MSLSLNQSPSWISHWRKSRLIIMPLVILGVGLLLSSIQGRSATAESQRVHLFLMQILEETALDQQSMTHSLDVSDSIVATEFRMRIRRSAGQLKSAIPQIEVKVGDFGVGSAGNATHTALACYQGGEAIAVRVIAIPGDSDIKVVGVFAPNAAEFSSLQLAD